MYKISTAFLKITVNVQYQHASVTACVSNLSSNLLLTLFLYSNLNINKRTHCMFVWISELVLSDTTCNPEFIQELLPSAERTALLYHLSYLCLGGFPKLERLLRERAVETQMLFGSSEAVLLRVSMLIFQQLY